MMERYQIVGCSKCPRLNNLFSICYFGKPADDCPTFKAAQAGDLEGSANPPSKPRKQRQAKRSVKKPPATTEPGGMHQDVKTN